MEHYSAINKMEILPFVTMWMNLEGIKGKKSDSKRQILNDLMYRWNFF